jgi:opacity protein-like surface antigen
MKKLFIAMALVSLFCIPAFAQDYPKAEVFGGFSVLSVGDGDRWNPLGFQASVAGNLNETFGIVGDFGAQFKDSAHVFEYMGGPRFTYRTDAVSVFGHALFGGVTIGNGSSESAFAMGFGGGLDVNINESFAVRAIQFDWIPLRDDGIWYNNQVRFGFGIVIK